MSSVDTSNLVTLAANTATKYRYDNPGPDLLEAFASPFADPKLNRAGGVGTVYIEVPEFTSLCVVGATRVDVACDERTNPHGVPIECLVGTSGTVFSFDPAKGKPVARTYSNVRKTRENVDCVRVSFFLYKGPANARHKVHKSIVCTPDHEFLVRTGWGKFSWVRADELKPDAQLVADQRHGDSIRGVARHRLVAENSVGRVLEEGELVHHLDHCHENNTPNNLEVTGVSAHAAHHRSAQYGYDASIDVGTLVEKYLSGVGVPELAQEYGCDTTTITTRLLDQGVSLRSQREALLLKTRTPAFVAMMNEARDLYEQGYTTGELAQYYGVHPVTISSWVEKSGGRVRTSLATKELRESAPDLTPLNHRVTSVEPAGQHDVFCMQVEDTQCFFAEGVVVHNCPLTGQPDFATIVIDYRPAALCVESKSLKLYMMAYRNTGEFHEACVTRILNDLVQVLKPVYMRVTGRFTPRGGIPFHPTVSYHIDDSGTDLLPGLFDAEVPGA